MGWNAGPKFLLFIGILIFGVVRQINGIQHLDNFLDNHPEVSEFFKLVQSSPFLRSAILWKKGSLFVPKNEAVAEYERNGGRITNSTIIYHFCNFPMTLSAIEKEKFISTETTGNSPIWITKTGKGLFLNDARYVIGNFRIFMQSQDTDPAAATVVHIIDRVLDLTIPGSQSSYLFNPDAGKFLNHVSAYDVTKNQQANVFKTDVEKHHKLDLFKLTGSHTFFIPVDAGFRKYNPGTIELDDKVISGHIIHGTVIFLRTLEEGEIFDTYQARVNLTQRPTEVKGQQPFCTSVSFEESAYDGQHMWLVNGLNKNGDNKHRNGLVQAEIVQGNIPVKNGVIHLISKPLVVIDMNVLELFEFYSKENDRKMSQFFELARKLFARGGRLAEEIRQLLNGQGSRRKVTLFVPSNQAVDNLDYLTLKNNLTGIAELIRTHIVLESVSAKDMIEHSRMNTSAFQVQTAFPGRKLLFSHFVRDEQKAIHVEGDGVNASIIQADFGATNGYIHMIDRVLGVPDQTVQEKLETNPMLRSTYLLWEKVGMDDLLINHTEVTIFAPSDSAWNKLRNTNPAAYKNLFQSKNAQHNNVLRDILWRHIIPHGVYDIQHLLDSSVALNNTSVTTGRSRTLTDLPNDIGTNGVQLKVNASKTLLGNEVTQRSQVGHNESYYYVYWDRKYAHIIRPNVRCTDGIIHIIDEVLMDSKEIGSTATSNTIFLWSLLFPLSFHFRLLW